MYSGLYFCLRAKEYAILLDEIVCGRVGKVIVTVKERG